ncbi:tetratricopeptide repeat protein [Dactylosporangium sp. NPDC005572]|uniref:tetratricopeptide repeat protein n=1 Tax=Dactylosporangium sp. NPDC005572 TaxID=3156889 RepID=UPI0033A39C16
MILACSGWGCNRLISVSSVPGGNPVARADPEHYAMQFQICPDCHKNFCDRCVPKGRLFSAARCRDCGGKLADGAQRTKVLAQPKAAVVQLDAKGYDQAVDGRMADALATFEEVVRQRPEFAAAHFHRALALRNLGRPADAIAALERVVAIDPGYAQALFDIGGIHRSANDMAAAVVAYDRAIAVHSRYVSALVNKAISLSDGGRTEEAVRAADDAIRAVEAGETPDDVPNARAFAYGAKAAALLKLGRWQESLEAVDVAIDDGPDDYDNYKNRAFALEKLGRLEESRHAASIAAGLRR